MKLTITGPIPSKKNRLHPRKDRKGYFNPDHDRLQDIVYQILMQVGNIEPLNQPSLMVHFKCSNGRGDLDGKLTTLLDCMVRAGILVNDNLTHLPGPVTYSGEIAEMDEATVIIE